MRAGGWPVLIRHPDVLWKAGGGCGEDLHAHGRCRGDRDLGGIRLGKDDLRVEAIGTVDECNAAIGGSSANVWPDLRRQLNAAALPPASQCARRDRDTPLSRQAG